MTSKSKFINYFFRVSILIGVAVFLSLERNPVVVIIAKLGLSPSPLERLFGVKGVFSGMTEGMFRLVHGNFLGALDANVFTPAFAVVFIVCVLTGYRPKIKNRKQELIFLLLVVFLSLIVNIYNPPDKL